MTRGVPALWPRFRATIEMDISGIAAYTQEMTATQMVLFSEKLAYLYTVVIYIAGLQPITVLIKGEFDN